MYLHIGNEMVVPFKDIIAIVNLSTIVRSAVNNEILKRAKQQGNDPDSGDYKSCIITEKQIYLSNISSGTLMKRASSILSNLEQK
ncbi:extracellular matrix regulator RemB [Moorella sulfitireducens (nom. illeg.)]|uniref:extracellular matrix regulator RemB n=1 Tax=Neomoorella sulfitireducens TaxID=2972948 RepID=UPI0021ACE415|nr:DUF370 domain-containing protein [Moorella sulfitireducens]